MPTIHFYPETELCLECGLKLCVQKTRTKKVVIMDIGAFEAKETVLHCPQCRAVYASEQLRSLAPDKCTFGFDVIVHVGFALFVHCRSHQEIMTELTAKNISISESEISYLGRKFVVYLALAHRQSRAQLRMGMAKRGGYILHLDGTCEGDSPHLFIGLDDHELRMAASSLELKAEVFDKLRDALRIAPAQGKMGLNDDGEDDDIETIEKRVTEFRQWLEQDEARKKTYAKMIEQLDKYWEKLFADPILVSTPEGEVVIFPQRTDNILERFFRGEKRRGRKRTGVASLSKTLKTIIAETPMVRNLENDEYVKIILGGCENLEERFAQIEAELVRKHLQQAQNSQDRICPEIKKPISQSDLPQKISTLFGVLAK